MPGTFTFTAPPAAIADLSGTLSSGGSLAASTTYYYMVIAVNSDYIQQYQICTGRSNIFSITTDTTNKTVNLTWTAPSGTWYYCIFRTTSTASDRWEQPNVRLNGTSGGAYATTSTNSFIDDGTRAGSTESRLLPAIDSTKMLPLGIDPVTYGVGYLTMSGGTSASPITPVDIYNYAVTYGYTNYIKYDGVNLVMMCAFYNNSSTETHFVAVKHNLYLFGYFNWNNTNSNSNMTFGELTTSKQVKSVSNIYILHSGYVFYFGKVTMYGTNIADHTSMTFRARYVTGYGEVAPYIWVYSSGALFYKVNLVLAQIIFNTLYIGVNGLLYGGFYGLQYNACAINVNYSSDYLQLRNQYDIIEQFYIYYNSYDHSNIYAMSSRQTYHVDCQWYPAPGYYIATDIPTIYWAATVPSNEYQWICNKLYIKIIDKDGNPVENATIVSFLDKYGNAVSDLQAATALAGLTSDADGYIWIEKIPITSGSTTTSLQSTGKSWTPNKWRGRTVYIQSGAMAGNIDKILSNDSDTINLVTEMALAPASGDRAGIIPWICRVRLSHTNGTGAGVGAAFTTVERFSPFSITVRKTGYKDAVVTFEMINEPKHLEIVMQPHEYPQQPWGM